MGISVFNSAAAILFISIAPFCTEALASDLSAPIAAIGGSPAYVIVAAKPAASKAKSAVPASSAREFTGNASWYGVPFHGRKTASGEIFDMNKMTAAHKSLTFHTRVLVESPKTGKSVVVKVNDRGPYAKGRVLDLAREAFRRLGTMSSGVTYVECLVVDDNDEDNDSGKAKSGV